MPRASSLTVQPLVLGAAMLGAAMLGAAVAPSATAGEASPADARAEARALWNEASRAGDVWTALQLEAWSAANDGRLRQLLGSTAVHGDARMAFGAEIVAHWDRGPRVGVLTRSRFHLLAADGRPLALATPLKLPAGLCDWTFSGDVVATAERQGAKVVLVAQRVPGVEVISELTAPCDAADTIGSLRCADDGSALMCDLARHPPLQTPVLRVVIARRGAKPQFIDEAYEARAIGPNGAWWALRQRGDGRMVVNTVAGKELTVGSIAVGPGCCMVMNDRQLRLVGRDGAIRPFAPTIGIGSDGETRTIGSWLVIWSGSDAVTPDGVDPLGNPIPGGAAQPPTIACYRWREVAELGERAAPTATYAAPLSPADAHSLALYAWEGREVFLIDLTDESEPRRRALLTAPVPVQVVDHDQMRTRVRLEDGSSLIADSAGRELWRGPCDAVDLNAPDWAVVRVGASDAARYACVRMDVDPAKRAVTPVAVAPGPWQIELDRFGRFGVAVRPEQVWHRFDMRSGEVTGSGSTLDPAVQRPQPLRAVEPPGRFSRRGGRLIDKVHGDFGAPPELALSPIDAWRVGRAMVLLNIGGQVLVSGRKPGELIDVGRSPEAQHLAPGDGELLLVNDAREPLARLVPGPALSTDGIATLKPNDFGNGYWRIDPTGRFVPPSMGVMAWDEARLGFAPLRLRSARDASPLVVVTQSLVLEIDAATVRLVCRPAPN